MAAMLSAALLMTGCAAFQNMSSTGKGATIGGGGGAVAGAGIGALAGGGKGAAIGTLVGAGVGAGVGALIGKRMDKQKAELEKKLKAYEQKAAAGIADELATKAVEKDGLKFVSAVVDVDLDVLAGDARKLRLQDVGFALVPDVHAERHGNRLSAHEERAKQILAKEGQRVRGAAGRSEAIGNETGHGLPPMDY